MLAVVALVCFALGRAATAVLVTVIVAAAAFELFEGFRRAGFQPATLSGSSGSLSLVGIAYNHGERAFPLVTALVDRVHAVLVPGQGRATPGRW